MGDTSPICAPADFAATVAWHGSRPVSMAAFIADVEHLAAGLPARRYAINLCDNRYAFTVGFVAALARGQVNLLPPSRAPAALALLAERYPDAYALAEHAAMAGDMEVVSVVPSAAAVAGVPGQLPQVAAEHVAAVVFTSGTTAEPVGHPKTWGSLAAGARSVVAELDLEPLAGASLLATVPPQHMFGLEFSVVLPLVGGFAASAARPLLPADVTQAVGALPRPRILVTTPVHLRACLSAQGHLPAVDVIISATAPLSQALAREAEGAFGARVLEIYGATETGAVATRRTAAEPLWRLFAGLQWVPSEAGATISGAHLNAPVTVGDRVAVMDGRHFELLGRDQDVVKVAGKRGSLAELNRALLEIPGVEDGVVFMPDQGEGLVTRLVALVVAPAVEEDHITKALARRFDAAFLPRPLYRVVRLPRTDTGKLRRSDLLELLRVCGERHERRGHGPHSR